MPGPQADTKIEIISTPKTDNSDSTEYVPEHQFGFFETKHSRTNQEDALAWHVLTQEELTPEGAEDPLTLNEIGDRLWTGYQVLNKQVQGDSQFNKCGTTASTTVYDGKGNLITATLGDAAAFAVIYGKEGNVLRVVRLNEVTHKPTDSDEKKRIEKAGGKVYAFGNEIEPKVRDKDVKGVGVSRSIGDRSFTGVCSEANIDTTNISKIAEGITDIGTIQIISTCDGFTDASGKTKQSKEDHEDYLFKALKNIELTMKSPAGTLPEGELAKQLVELAKSNSKDNISVAIQTITRETPPLLMGIYDGHGEKYGKKAACYVAENMGIVFKEQCALTREAYKEHEFSVDKKATIYNRDNTRVAQDPKATNDLLNHSPPPECASIVKKLQVLALEYQNNLNTSEDTQIKPIITNLVNVLNKTTIKPQEQIKQFYNYLNQTTETNKKPNIEIIAQDKHSFTSKFLRGIAIVAATLATGVLPGLLVIGIVCAATGKHPGDLLKTDSERFKKELDLLKEKIPETALTSEDPNSNNPEQGSELNLQ